MGYLKLRYHRKGVYKRLTNNSLISKNELDKFNLSILGLGDLNKEGEKIDSIVAFLDLEGFTSFCDQSDSHLIVPRFIKKYLTWLMDEIKTTFLMESHRTKDHIPDKDHVWIYGTLPMYSKFLGDGVLLIWDLRQFGGQLAIGNIIIGMDSLCRAYKDKFHASEGKKFSKMPSILRCGIARGQIISIGKYADFVGPCINLAARLQKMPGLTFAVSGTGIDIEECFNGEPKMEHPFVLQKTIIRGINVEQVIFVKREELELLSKENRTEYW